MFSITWKATLATRQDVAPCRLPALFGCSTVKPVWTRRLPKRKIVFFETLEGLEARANGQPVAVLRDYRSYTHMSWVDQRNLPPVLNFEPCAAPPGVRELLPQIDGAHKRRSFVQFYNSSRVRLC